MTRLLVFLLVSNVCLVCMSPICRFRSGFCAIMMPSAFLGVRSSGILYVISLGFLRFWIFISSWSPHLSWIWEFSNYLFLVSASIRTCPFLRLFSDVIPIFIPTGSIFYFSSFISFVVWFPLGFSVSLCRSSFLPPTISENSFFFP